SSRRRHTRSKRDWSSDVCSSDLHENMGTVEEVGSGVTTVSQGDRVVMPFNVACGFCDNCRAGKSAFCLTVNDPGTAGGAYGYVRSEERRVGKEGRCWW